jgi:hypothetical protein
MEQNDSDLRELLREWKAPEASPSLEARVLRGTTRCWSVLLHGYIRVPVPVACCLAVLMIGAAWRLAKPPADGCSAASLTTPAIARRPLPAPPANASKQNAATACAVDSSC